MARIQNVIYVTHITEVIFAKHTTNQTETQMQINEPQIGWMLMFMVRKESKDT